MARKNTSMVVTNECGKFGKSNDGAYYLGPISLFFNKELAINFKNVKEIAKGIYIGEPKL